MAFAEANERFVAGEAAGGASHTVIEQTLRALRMRDWATMREKLGEDVVIEDHRKLGFGRIERDAWLESWRVAVELAPDVSTERFRTLGWNEHGRVWCGRMVGTRDGGEFENLLITLATADARSASRLESFEIDDAERALARFEDPRSRYPESE